MALWDNLGSIGKVEDRRGSGGLAFGGGAAVVGVVLFLALNYFGVQVDPALLEQVIGTANNNSQTQQAGEFAGDDDYEVFARSVLGSTDDYWSDVFSKQNTTYETPRLVLFRSATQSGCGIASSQVGPHYCPADQTIYLDETFFDNVLARIGGDNGDVAQAYVIAHEVGHHVQTQLGTMDQVQSDPSYARSGENSLSVRLELQADCYAGLWAHSLRDRDVFGPGEIDEAIRAAEAVGDDNIQQATQGSINPETWTHGSSQERARAFNRGYDSGQISVCEL